MPTVLLSSDSAGRAIVARPARLRERLAARFTPTRLDRELAAGVAPEADGALALRAQRLVGHEVRESLGRQLVRIVLDAHTGGHPWLAAQVPLSRHEVAEAADELAAIAARLLGPEPVAAQGVAAVHLLLSDGTGPLYFRGNGPALDVAVADARAGLEPAAV
jgi:hypothetical protein